MDNGETEVHVFAQMHGEADLDALMEPIDIPEMTIPIIGVTTPAVEEFSLWMNTGLGLLLTTPQQVIDSAVNKNSRMITKNIMLGKDKVEAFLMTAVEQMKEEYEQYNIELPKTLTIPAYKVPVMNVEVTSFTIPLPDP